MYDSPWRTRVYGRRWVWDVSLLSGFAVWSIGNMAYSALRDALAEKIWEGTVTVLAMDIIRAAAKPEVLQSFVSVRLFL